MKDKWVKLHNARWRHTSGAEIQRYCFAIPTFLLYSTPEGITDTGDYTTCATLTEAKKVYANRKNMGDSK